MRNSLKLTTSTRNCPIPTCRLRFVRAAWHAKRSEDGFETAVKANRDNAKTLAAYAQWLLQTGDVARAERARRPPVCRAGKSRGAHPERRRRRMAKKMKPAEDYYVAALRFTLQCRRDQSIGAPASGAAGRVEASARGRIRGSMPCSSPTAANRTSPWPGCSIKSATRAMPRRHTEGPVGEEPQPR